MRDTFAPSRALGSLRPPAPSQAGVLRPRTDGDWPTRHARPSAVPVTISRRLHHADHTPPVSLRTSTQPLPTYPARRSFTTVS